MNVQEIAYKLQNIFLENNFVVQRYDAYTTKSIYMKLDYGICHTIRISDHNGYSHLSYRYNIRLDIDHDYKEVDKKGFTRYYFCPRSIPKLVAHIKQYRQGLIQRYGEKDYSYKVQKAYLANYNSVGFWSNVSS